MELVQLTAGCFLFLLQSHQLLTAFIWNTVLTIRLVPNNQPNKWTDPSVVLMMSLSVPAQTLVSSACWSTAAASLGDIRPSPHRLILSRRGASSVSACMWLWSELLMFCGLCFSEADWKWFSMVSKQTNNTLYSKTLNCVSSSSQTVKAAFRPNHCCPQTHLNEIRLLQAETHWITSLNSYGEAFCMRRSWAKKKRNKESTKKIKHN